MYCPSCLRLNECTVKLSLRQAQAVDQLPEAGLLHGEPILIKDNIDVAGMATTAGSLALKDNMAKVDAPVVSSLKKHGAVVIGKTNLSEWACFRDDYTKVNLLSVIICILICL